MPPRRERRAARGKRRPAYRAPRRRLSNKIAACSE
jgi:hypothetical protein